MYNNVHARPTVLFGGADISITTLSKLEFSGAIAVNEVQFDQCKPLRY
jgi:hypothetical protein